MLANPNTAGNPPAATGRERFDRLLYRAYSRSSHVRHFFSVRIRPPGISVLLLFVLATCLGIGQGRTSIYQLFSLCFAMLATSFIYIMFRRAKLHAHRELPRHATAGHPLRYSVIVRNNGRKIRSAWLSETLPDPRPTIDDFTLLREPGEEERNKFDQLFAYFRWQWLILRNQLFRGGESPDEINLLPNATTRVNIEFTPLRRGVIRLNDLRVLLPDPFGLFQRSRRVNADASTLMVLPHRFQLPPIELPGNAAFNISGESNTNAIGNSGEFVGLRDYRPGDPIRQIHWKSWARTGRPIVKELENTFYPRYGLILDTISTDRTDVTFEQAVSVAASFAASIDTSESLLDLMFVKNQAHVVTAGRGLQRAERLLEVLAGVTPERTPCFETLSRLVLRYRDDLTSCLVIFNGWDDQRKNFLQTLTQHNITCAPIIIGAGPNPGNAPGCWLQSGHIATDLKRLPSRLPIAN
ncbi:MAG: DUF58 domain-containing protein [Verrucomicrobiales bacterium]|nr:DUF58 domain-containing protein [Verrucomicrobiota bacterium JB025]